MATMGELDAKAIVDILAGKLSDIKAKTLGYTLGHVDCGELLDTLSYTPDELQVEKPADIPCIVEAYELVDVLAYKLAVIKNKTHAAG